MLVYNKRGGISPPHKVPKVSPAKQITKGKEEDTMAFTHNATFEALVEDSVYARVVFRNVMENMDYVPTKENDALIAKMLLGIEVEEKGWFEGMMQSAQFEIELDENSEKNYVFANNLAYAFKRARTDYLGCTLCDYLAGAGE